MSGGFTFYDITHDGVLMSLPRVTSLLGVLDKSGPLMWWATKIEREAMREALEEALTSPGAALDAHALWTTMDGMLKGKRAWVKKRDDAANIGTQAHEWIRWKTRTMLGEAPGAEPGLSDAAMRSVDAWLDWVKAVDYEPLYTERLVYCPSCAAAGTLDGVGKATLDGVRQAILLDIKTGKAVYSEAHLQVNFYRHMAKREGIETDAGLILRLPKTAADPGFEPVPMRPVPLGALRAVAMSWRLMRWMNEESTGSAKMTACEVGA